MPDDYLATTSTDGTVSVGGSATGEIESQGDRDWFAITLVAGRTYRIDLEGFQSDGGTLGDPYLHGIYDADGNLISGTANDDRGWLSFDSQVTFTPTASGTFYIAAGAYGSSQGTYTVSVTDVTDGTPDDYAAIATTTGTVTAGGSTTGEIEYDGDRDWFAVTLEAGKSYRIDLEGSRTGDGTLSDPFLRGIYDASGTLIGDTANDDGGTGLNSRVTFSPGQAGIFYISAGAYGSSQGIYTVSVIDVTDGPPDDYAADATTIATVAVGGSANGEIEYDGDRDWFAVTLEAGKSYRIDLEGSRTGGGTLWDPFLRGVHDASGTLIDDTTDDDSGTRPNSRVTFTPEQGGTFYIAAGAFRSSQGTYTVSVTEVVDDYAADTTTTGTVAVGGSANGEIQFTGDRDWFAVTLEAGKIYQIELKGSSSGSSTLGDPFLRGIHDASGTLIDGTENDDRTPSSNESRVAFTPSAAGTYYIAAGAYTGSIGTYQVSVTEVMDDYAAAATTIATVAVGGSATGDIQFTGDHDWFAVTLEAGKIYRIELEGASSGGGTLADPFLRGIHDADGTLIDGTENDDGEPSDVDSRVSFTPSADGTYHVSAGAYRGHTGTYRVSVTEIVDDYADDTTTTGTVSVGGSATGDVQFADDRDWFAVILKAGKTYQIDLEGAGTGDNTLRNPYLRGVHDADGTLIDGTANDNRGYTSLDSRVIFTPSADGTYYVSAGSNYGRIGTYQVSVTEVTDDYAGNTATTGTVAVGGSATGNIQFANDHDWFAVTLKGGKTYRIDLEGSQGSAGTLRDPYLYGVHDADGALIDDTANDDRGWGHRDSQVTFTPSADGTYYVAAGAYRENTGTYELSVTEEGM